MNPYFSLEEYQQRYSRARALMAEAGLDALFLTSDRNLYYLSGHQPFQPWDSTTRPTLLIAPRDSDPILVSHYVWRGAAARDTWIDDVRGYGDLTGVPTEFVASLFRELGLERGRIGAELGLEQRLGMPPADFYRLGQALPEAKWVDAASLLWELRMIKSPAEIECIRKSCSAVMGAFQSVYPTLTTNFTQEEFVHRIQSSVCQNGADFGFINAGWDAQTHAAMACLPSSEHLKRGELICADVGAVYHGYWCDFSRAASLDRPSNDVLRTWEAIYRVTMAGVGAVRPGIPIGELVRACAAEAERQALDFNFKAGRMGHSLGLMLTEPPSVTLDETRPMQPGMVLTLEPGIVSPEGVFVVEQNFVVTEEGADLLSAGPWEIWVP